MTRDQESLPNSEHVVSNPQTEASNNFVRNAFWKTSETLWDIGRIGAIPFRLAGNIAKNLVQMLDDIGPEGDADLGLVVYGMGVMPIGGLALAGGIAILASNPIGWVIAGGIGLATIGGILELPVAYWLGAGVIKGSIDTYKNGREKRKELVAKRAERRANWQ